MGGEGHMLSMIQRIKENNALRRSKREKFKKNQGVYSSGINEKLVFKEVSEEDLKLIKKKNLKKIEYQEFQRLLRFVIIVLGIALFSFLVFR